MHEWIDLHSEKQQNGCMNFLGCTDHHGYGSCRFKGVKWKSHRLAYTLAKGEIPKGLSILHACDNRLCINPDHLSPGTVAENNAECRERGRFNGGLLTHREICYSRRILKSEQVIAIRRSRALGVNRKKLANEFCVSLDTIDRVVKGKTYQNI